MDELLRPLGDAQSVVAESDATNLAVVESVAHLVLRGEQADLVQSVQPELLEQSALCALQALVAQRDELVLVVTVEFVEPVDSMQY